MRALDPARERELRSSSLTYEPLGGSLVRPLPSGFHHVVEQREVGRGEPHFERVAAALTAWRVHERAGLDVRASSGTAHLDDVVELRVGVGAVGLSVPCRVVAVLDEPARRGFAYGTLPGHQERGEEAFVVTIDEVTELVTMHVTAFSAPASRLARAGGPVARAVQRWQTRRYLDAAEAAGASAL